MTFAEFLTLLVTPVGALVIGYLVLRGSERDSRLFDEKQKRAAH